MKITKKQLQVIIREELEQIVNERSRGLRFTGEAHTPWGSEEPDIDATRAGHQRRGAAKRIRGEFMSGEHSLGDPLYPSGPELEPEGYGSLALPTIPPQYRPGGASMAQQGRRVDPRKGMEESLINDITEAVLVKLTKR